MFGHIPKKLMTRYLLPRRPLKPQTILRWEWVVLGYLLWQLGNPKKLATGKQHAWLYGRSLATLTLLGGKKLDS
jgi:hypothetical protein